ncbi:MAG: DUF2953 domain-containing protein [Ruminococcaceae bacterium]|nr:DUF2953 domain-containing protein [Oscillospiraceae bacterium]
MNVLWIILAVLGGILLLLGLLLAFGRAKLRIRYRENLRITVYICGIPIPIRTKKKEEKKKKNLSRCRNPERVLRRELRRQKKAAQRAHTRAERKKVRALQKKKRAQQHGQSKSSPLRLIENLELILQLLKTLRKETKGQIRLRIRAMQIHVGTEDAAKTAILYGTVLQSASFLLGWIDTHFKRVPSREGELEISPDYLSGATSANIDIECSLYVSKLISLALKLLTTHQSTRKKILRARVKKARSKKI